MRLDVSDNLQYTQNPGEVSSKANEDGRCQQKQEQAGKEPVSFFPVRYIGCQEEV